MTNFMYNTPYTKDMKFAALARNVICKTKRSHLWCIALDISREPRLYLGELTICSSSVMGMLLLLFPGVGELCEDECDEDTVDEEERDVAQFPLPEVVLFRGGVGGGTGLARVEQSLELRLGERREGKLSVFVHWAKLRTILLMFLFFVYLLVVKLIQKCFNWQVFWGSLIALLGQLHLVYWHITQKRSWLFQNLAKFTRRTRIVCLVFSVQAQFQIQMRTSRIRTACVDFSKAIDVTQKRQKRPSRSETPALSHTLVHGRSHGCGVGVVQGRRHASICSGIAL